MRSSTGNDLAQRWQQYLQQSRQECAAGIPQQVLAGHIELVKRFVYEPPASQPVRPPKPSCVLCRFPAHQVFTLHHRVEKRDGVSLGFADAPYLPAHFLAIPKKHGSKVPGTEDIAAALQLLADLGPGMRGHVNLEGSSASIREHIHVQFYDVSELPGRKLPIEAARKETLLDAGTTRVSLLADGHWPTGAIIVESCRPRTAARWTRNFTSALEEARVAYNLVLTATEVYIVPRIAERIPRRAPFPEPLQGKGIGGLEIAGVFIAERKAMYDCLTRDAYWLVLETTAYSPADVRNGIQSIRSCRWLRPHVSKNYRSLFQPSKELVSRALASRAAQVVVGIPFVAGTDGTLPHVVTTIAEGLRRHYPGRPALILPVGEVDAASCLSRLGARVPPDSSRGCLTLVPTTKNSSLLRGKGWSVRLVLEIARRLDAHVLLFDADLVTHKTGLGNALAGLSPDWVRTFLDPIFQGTADFVAPGYRRHFQEARLTNPVVFPLFSAMYGINMRQPIGGEFALSKSLVADLCAANPDIWFGPVGGYGIDIWLSANAAKSRTVNIARLGVKLQDMRAVLGPYGLRKDVFMFEQVVGALFDQLARDRAWLSRNGAGRPREVRQVGPASPPIHLDEHPGADEDLLALLHTFRNRWPAYQDDYTTVLPEDIYKTYLDRALSSTGDCQISARCWARTLFHYLRWFGSAPEMSAGKRQVMLRGLANLYSAYLVSHLRRIVRHKQRTGASDEELSAGFVEEQVLRLRDAFLKEKRRNLDGRQ